MQNFIEQKLIPYLSLILGISICCSTSAMSISYVLIAIIVLFTKDFIINLKNSFHNEFIIGCLGLYLLFILGITWSIADLSDTFKILIKIIGFLLAPLFLIAFKTNNSGKLFLKGFILSAVLSAALSLISFIINKPFLHGIKDAHWVIFHGHILHNAFIAIASTFLLCFMLDKNQQKTLRVISFCIYVICFIDVMFVVNGRTGQFMLISMNMFSLIYQLKPRKLLILGTIIIMITSVLYIFPTIKTNMENAIVSSLLTVSPAIKKGFEDYKMDEEKYKRGDVITSMGLRKEFHRNSIQIIKLKPLIGHGTGSFTKSYKEYTNFAYPRATTNPHCDILWVGVELGILGIAGFILMVIFAGINIIRLNSISFYKNMSLSLIFGYVLASYQNSFFIDNVTGSAFIFIMLAIISINNHTLKSKM